MDSQDDKVGDAGGAGASNPLKKLPDAQVFARDAEDYSQEDMLDTLERLRKVVERKRKARRDDAAVAEAAAKMKKVNAAAKKKKAKQVVDPMEKTI